MMNRFQSKHIGMIAIAAGSTGAIIYAVMINVTLAHIEAVSGLAAFDMRPLGYGPAEAEMLLKALGADGRAYYLSHQIALDTLYPAMLALTLIAAILWFGKPMRDSRLVRLGIAVSVGCALFDYIENLGIVAMLLSGPDVSSLLVFFASAATIAKSALTTLAILMTLFIGIVGMRLAREELRL